VAAQEAERARISRELHDVVGQALLAVRLNLLALERVDARTGASGAAILDSITAVDAALREVRTAAFDLRPALLDDLGLAAALGALCRALAARAGVAIACRVDIGGQRLPTEIETTCFRVVQEALTNAVRHAKARRVSVALELHPATGLLVLEVSDDGVGFDPTGCEGVAAIGIAGMTERAALVGGHVSVRSGRGSGTTVVGRFRVDRVGCAAQ
jgi:signal transduction histidine kinase